MYDVNTQNLIYRTANVVHLVQNMGSNAGQKERERKRERDLRECVRKIAINNAILMYHNNPSDSKNSSSSKLRNRGSENGHTMIHSRYIVAI